MKAIASPCVDLFTCTASHRVGFCSNAVAITRHGGAFLAHQTALGGGLRLAITYPVCPLSAAQTNAETEQAVQTISSDQCETVRVRFKLQKQCAFGQEFRIVGNVNVLGSWNPVGGKPLIWSEGHMWSTTEVDLPVNKLIKYKFVLGSLFGDCSVSWQHGPDRILKPWKSEKIISVYEDWENPGFQTVVEEEPTPDPYEADLELFIEEMNSTTSVKENPKVDGNDNQVMKQSTTTSRKKVVKKAKGSSKKEMSLSDNSSAEEGKTQVKNEEGPVLVQGLVTEEEIGESKQNKAEVAA